MTTSNTILSRVQKLEDRRAELRGPVDGLSASLWELGAELAALDELERAIAAKEMGVAPDAVKKMARSYAPRLKR